jgi:hypothetical protein
MVMADVGTFLGPTLWRFASGPYWKTVVSSPTKIISKRSGFSAQLLKDLAKFNFS